MILRPEIHPHETKAQIQDNSAARNSSPRNKNVNPGCSAALNIRRRHFSKAPGRQSCRKQEQKRAKQEQKKKAETGFIPVSAFLCLYSSKQTVLPSS